MKIIKPSFEFYGEVPTDYASTIKFIEKCGRTCYKSESKITETSADKFVNKLIAAGHLAMVEHSNFVVRSSHGSYFAVLSQKGKYLNTVVAEDDTVFIGGNLTAWYNQLQKTGPIPFMLPFIKVYGDLFGVSSGGLPEGEWGVCSHEDIPDELRRYSIKVICDRGVSHEFVRHRPVSFAQESTRYVNYKGKDMEMVEPAGFEQWPDLSQREYKIACQRGELGYNKMIADGRSPQQARAVLPNSLKTELIATTDIEEWKHIFNLRCHKTAHPDFRRVIIPVRDRFMKEGLI